MFDSIFYTKLNHKRKSIVHFRKSHQILIVSLVGILYQRRISRIFYLEYSDICRSGYIFIRFLNMESTLNCLFDIHPSPVFDCVPRFFYILVQPLPCIMVILDRCITESFDFSPYMILSLNKVRKGVLLQVMNKTHDIIECTWHYICKAT